MVGSEAAETTMKTIFKAIARVLKRQPGFTLVELVVVIAIMGVMAAIAVPMVNDTLGRSKEQAWNTDLALIQGAVEAFHSSPGNERFLGQRQYPIIGRSSTGTLQSWDNSATAATIATTPLNPLRGTKGGEPKWRDGGADGLRTEADLNNEHDSIDGGGSGGYVFKRNLEGTDYVADSRDFLIDFNVLVAAGLMKNVPDSASTDNPGGSSKGSYIWYVDEIGVVNALNTFFPTNGVKDTGLNIGLPATGDDSVNNGGDNRGFQTGVYP